MEYVTLRRCPSQNDHVQVIFDKPVRERAMFCVHWAYSYQRYNEKPTVAACTSSHDGLSFLNPTQLYLVLQRLVDPYLAGQEKPPQPLRARLLDDEQELLDKLRGG